MNPKQIGDIIRGLLLSAGVSGTVLGYVSSEVWLAVGGVVFAVGAGIAQVISARTKRLIEAVAKAPEEEVEVPPAIAAAVKKKVVPFQPNPELRR